MPQVTLPKDLKSFANFGFIARVATKFAFALLLLNDASADIDDLNPSVDGARLSVSKPFILARAHLLHAGWKPVRMHINDNDAYVGTEHGLVKRGLLEFDACSIDAGVLCDFYYRKADKCLRVDTIGEQVQSMKVLHWMQECSPDEQPAQSRSGAPSGK
jgi:hypothetical protein